MDYGGPKREFFRLLIEEITQSEYMHGGMKKFLTADVFAIQVIYFQGGSEQFMYGFL